MFSIPRTTVTERKRKMKITYTSFNGKTKKRSKSGSVGKVILVYKTIKVALKELHDPLCTAVNIRLTKEVK